MATAILLSHHGLRRDIAEFAFALERLASGERSTECVSALCEEWSSYRATLHGHHQSEDERLFPHLRGQSPELAPVIEKLEADHARIDPQLGAGDRAFTALSAASGSSLPSFEDARRVVVELSALLDAHLATEERAVVPYLRNAKSFPPMGSDAERRTHSALAATEPAARLWSPPSTSGRASASSDLSAVSRSLIQTRAISRTYFLRSSAGRLVSGVGAGRSPLSTTIRPSAAI